MVDRESADRMVIRHTIRPRMAKPAPARNADWKPSVSASLGGGPGAAPLSSMKLDVRLVATAVSTATPSAAPTCWTVLISPDARLARGAYGRVPTGRGS